MRADTQKGVSRRIDSDRMDEKSCVDLVESVNSIVLRWNADFIITYMNDYGERFLGYRRAELVGRSVLGTIVPETSGENVDMAEMMRNIFRHPERYVNNENENLRKDGSRVWVSWTNRAVIGSDGRVVEIMSIGNDITDRKQMEKDLRRARAELEIRVQERTVELQASNERLRNEIAEHRRAENALRESESRFRKLVDRSPIPIAIYDLNEDAVLVNEKFVRTFGYTFEDVPNLKTWWPRAYPDRAYRQKVIDRWTEHLEKARTGSKEIEPMMAMVTCKDRSVLYVDFEGAFIGNLIMVTLQDITERKRAEEAILQLTRQDEEALRVAHMGHWEYDIATGMFIFNDQYYTLHGTTARAAGGYLMSAGEFARKYMDPDYAHIVKESIEAAQNTTDPNYVFQAESRILRVDGEPRDVAVWFRAEKDAEGKTVRLYGVSQDITERKQAERALEHAKAQAELYIDLMSHDISNMNQAIMGFLELAELTIPLEPEQRELIEKPIEIVNHSARMIDNVRKLERLQQRKRTEKVVDMCGILAQVLGGFSDVPGRCVTINNRSPGSCPVIADEMLRDVFGNIVENAIRHTSGPVTIDIVVDLLEEDGRRYYRSSISDNGPGIPDEQKRQVFAFLQGYKTRSGRRGLGLCLVKTLVEIFNGRVWVEDRVPGNYRLGAKFVVELPAAL